MSETIEQLVAIDLGNGSTSYIVGTGEIKGRFASLVAEAKSTQGLGSSFTREAIKTKAGNFYVGDDCREDGAASRSTDSSFYSSTAIRVLLVKVLKEAQVKNPIIVTGLPTEFFSDQRNAFADNIKRWAIEEGFAPAKVLILPQYVGPWFDPDLLDQNGQPIEPAVVMRGKLGIIDIGQGTIDAGQFVDGKASEHRYGESKGVSDIHKKLFTQLSKPEELNKLLGQKQRLSPDFRLDGQTNEYTMDVWLRQGFIPWRGKQLDIRALSLPARTDFANDVLPRCISKVWGSTDFFLVFICAGGGATVLGTEILTKHIHSPIYMAKDPEESIVRGFHRFYVTQYFKEHARVRLARA